MGREGESRGMKDGRRNGKRVKEVVYLELGGLREAGDCRLEGQLEWDVLAASAL